MSTDSEAQLTAAPPEIAEYRAIEAKAYANERMDSRSMLFGSRSLPPAKAVYHIKSSVPPDKTYPYFRSEIVGPGIEPGVIFIHEFESCGPANLRMLNMAYEQGRQSKAMEYATPRNMETQA